MPRFKKVIAQRKFAAGALIPPAAAVSAAAASSAPERRPDPVPVRDSGNIVYNKLSPDIFLDLICFRVMSNQHRQPVVVLERYRPLVEPARAPIQDDRRRRPSPPRSEQTDEDDRPLHIIAQSLRQKMLTKARRRRVAPSAGVTKRRGRRPAQRPPSRVETPVYSRGLLRRSMRLRPVPVRSLSVERRAPTPARITFKKRSPRTQQRPEPNSSPPETRKRGVKKRNDNLTEAEMTVLERVSEPPGVMFPRRNVEAIPGSSRVTHTSESERDPTCSKTRKRVESWLETATEEPVVVRQKEVPPERPKFKVPRVPLRRTVEKRAKYNRALRGPIGAPQSASDVPEIVLLSVPGSEDTRNSSKNKSDPPVVAEDMSALVYEDGSARDKHKGCVSRNYDTVLSIIKADKSALSGRCTKCTPCARIDKINRFSEVLEEQRLRGVEDVYEFRADLESSPRLAEYRATRTPREPPAPAPPPAPCLADNNIFGQYPKYLDIAYLDNSVIIELTPIHTQGKPMVTARLVPRTAETVANDFSSMEEDNILNELFSQWGTAKEQPVAVPNIPPLPAEAGERCAAAPSGEVDSPAQYSRPGPLSKKKAFLPPRRNVVEEPQPSTSQGTGAGRAVSVSQMTRRASIFHSAAPKSRPKRRASTNVRDSPQSEQDLDWAIPPSRAEPAKRSAKKTKAPPARTTRLSMETTEGYQEAPVFHPTDKEFTVAPKSRPRRRASTNVRDSPQSEQELDWPIPQSRAEPAKRSAKKTKAPPARTTRLSMETTESYQEAPAFHPTDEEFTVAPKSRPRRRASTNVRDYPQSEQDPDWPIPQSRAEPAKRSAKKTKAPPARTTRLSMETTECYQEAPVFQPTDEDSTVAPKSRPRRRASTNVRDSPQSEQDPDWPIPQSRAEPAKRSAKKTKAPPARTTRLSMETTEGYQEAPVFHPTDEDSTVAPKSRPRRRASTNVRDSPQSEQDPDWPILQVAPKSRPRRRASTNVRDSPQPEQELNWAIPQSSGHTTAETTRLSIETTEGYQEAPMFLLTDEDFTVAPKSRPRRRASTNVRDSPQPEQELDWAIPQSSGHTAAETTKLSIETTEGYQEAPMFLLTDEDFTVAPKSRPRRRASTNVRDSPQPEQELDWAIPQSSGHTAAETTKLSMGTIEFYQEVPVFHPTDENVTVAPKSRPRRRASTNVRDSPQPEQELDWAIPHSSGHTAEPTRRSAKRAEAPPAETTRLSMGTTECYREAPVFHPTDEEFTDPLAYFEKIAHIAAEYGVCKVVAPSSFKPACVLNDDVSFSVANQYLARLYCRWGAAAREMCAIKVYLAEQKVFFSRPPLIDGIELNLPKLYRTVQLHGGLKKVIEKKRWGRVAEDMRFPRGPRSAQRVDQLYVKHLLPYETMSNEERTALLDKVERSWSRNHARMVQRATNPLRRQRRLLDDAASCDSASDDEPEEEDEDTHLSIALAEAEDCVVAGRSMKLSAFKKVAENIRGNLFGGSSKSESGIEHMYWELVGDATEHMCVNTASIDTGEEGYGFTRHKDDPYHKHPWNLKMLSQNSGNVLRSLGPVVGVTVPTLHLGMAMSTSCWHRDPHGLPWIEYLHGGPAKIWYGIPDELSGDFRAAVEALCPTAVQNKATWLPSDITMIPPYLLAKWGVALSRVVQRPGEFIMVMPKAYSSSISTGYTQSESVYFATDSWLDDVADVFQELRDSCEPTMFSLEQLLIAVAKDWRSELTVLRAVHPILAGVVMREMTARRELGALGVTFALTQHSSEDGGAVPKKPAGAWNVREQDECEVCRTTLYLSKVTGILSKQKTSFCLEHALQILEKRRERTGGPVANGVVATLFVMHSELQGALTCIEDRLHVPSLVDPEYYWSPPPATI